MKRWKGEKSSKFYMGLMANEWELSSSGVEILSFFNFVLLHTRRDILLVVTKIKKVIFYTMLGSDCEIVNFAFVVFRSRSEKHLQLIEHLSLYF